MRLSDHDLRQIDDAYLGGLTPEALLEVSERLSQDLKEARDRLNQTPENSSRPPSTRAPWTAAQSEPQTEENEDPPEATEGAEDLHSEEESPKEPKVKGQTPPSGSPRQPGKQPGAPGHGRTQHLPVTGEVVHQAEQCAAAGQVLNEHTPFVPCTGHSVLGIEWGDKTAPGDPRDPRQAPLWRHPLWVWSSDTAPAEAVRKRLCRGRSKSRSGTEWVPGGWRSSSIWR